MKTEVKAMTFWRHRLQRVGKRWASGTSLLLTFAVILFGTAILAATGAKITQVSGNLAMPGSPSGDVNGDGNLDAFVYFAVDLTGVGYDNAYGYDIVAGNADGSFGPTRLGKFWQGKMAPDYFIPYAAGDVNGDGYGDVILAYPDAYNRTMAYAGKLKVFMGSSTGVSSTPSLELIGTSVHFRMGYDVRSLGDINRDGFGDVMIFHGEPCGKYYPCTTAHVYMGTSAGLSATPAWSELYYQVAAADVNGDGYKDLIATGNGKGFIFQGSAYGFSKTPAVWSEQLPLQPANGGVPASAGDVNHDGYEDVVIGEPGYDLVAGATCCFTNTNIGRAFLFLGSAAGLSSSPVWSAYPTNLSLAGQAVYGAKLAGIGDVNGDGYGDVLIGAPGQCQDWYLYNTYGIEACGQEGAIYLYLGTPTGLTASPAWVMAPNSYFNNQAYVRRMLGRAIIPLGDLNKDGYADFFANYTFYGGSDAASTNTISEGSTSPVKKGRGRTK